MAQSPARRVVCHGLVFIVTLGMTPLYAQSAVSAGDDEEHTSIRGALESSLRLATMQHLLRIGVQEKTRAELGGSFFGDYRRSLRVPRQWGDGDPGRTNYVGHPVQGAASGFIWIDNDPRAPRAFSSDGRYWTSRLRATGWAAGYSLQFEVGPFSEASIGNVGLQPQTAGWVDHVVTPTGAFAVMVGEDALDRFIIARLERKVGSPVARAALRMFLNPSRATANVAALRSPWHRPNRPFSWSSHPPDVAP
jgi:hypothetical protein